jgi:hypothetical protein
MGKVAHFSRGSPLPFCTQAFVQRWDERTEQDTEWRNALAWMQVLNPGVIFTAEYRHAEKWVPRLEYKSEMHIAFWSE